MLHPLATCWSRRHVMGESSSSRQIETAMVRPTGGVSSSRGSRGQTGWTLRMAISMSVKRTASVRIAFDVAEGVVAGQYERVIDGLPPGGNH